MFDFFLNFLWKVHRKTEQPHQYHWLYENHLLVNAKRWVGTSSGAIIAVLFVCGYEPVTIYHVLGRLPFQELANDINADGLAESNSDLS